MVKAQAIAQDDLQCSTCGDCGIGCQECGEDFEEEEEIICKAENKEDSIYLHYHKECYKIAKKRMVEELEEKKKELWKATLKEYLSKQYKNLCLER